MHLRRLDAAVTGSLRIARSGHVVPQELDLGDVLREAIQVAEPSFAAIRARLTAPAFVDAPVIRGDRDALRELFPNLLLNSQQAMAQEGTAVVTVTRRENRLTVSDCSRR